MKVSTKILGAGIGLAFAASAIQAQVIGDAAKGKEIADKVCVACHGADGNSIVPTFPRLAGQSAEYLQKQLLDFKKNKRQNEIMAPNAAALADEDMANLAAYFALQKVAATPPAANPALFAAGEKLFAGGNTVSGVPACVGCHGEAGAGSALFPRIAAQHLPYTLDQLKQFATGKRKNDKRLMQAVASRLTEEETQAVAHYVASLP